MIEREVRPPSPFRLPSRGSLDRVMRVRAGVVSRLLHVDGCPVLVRAWQPAGDRVVFHAEAVDAAVLAGPRGIEAALPRGAATADQLELALERMRFALGVDDNLADFHRRFRDDRLLGPLLRRRPYFRPARRPWPWEALAWAIVQQLIDAGRAGHIQRRIVGRWGSRLRSGGDALRDVPSAAVMAGRAPAELAAMDLSPRRAAALLATARMIERGICDPAAPESSRRLRAVPEIGPWTLQCLGLFGRGDHDSLPAGDLGYLKLVGRLSGMRRRATAEEVERFYAPYAPYRGLAGALTLKGLHRAVAAGPPLPPAASPLPITA